MKKTATKFFSFFAFATRCWLCRARTLAQFQDSLVRVPRRVEDNLQYCQCESVQILKRNGYVDAFAITSTAFEKSFLFERRLFSSLPPVVKQRRKRKSHDAQNRKTKTAVSKALQERTSPQKKKGCCPTHCNTKKIGFVLFLSRAGDVNTGQVSLVQL